MIVVFPNLGKKINFWLFYLAALERYLDATEQQKEIALSTLDF
jgi:hypothetical protein